MWPSSSVTPLPFALVFAVRTAIAGGFSVTSVGVLPSSYVGMLRAAAPALYLNANITLIFPHYHLPVVDVLAPDALEVSGAEGPDVLLAVACEYPTACGPLATMVSITSVRSMWGA